METKELTLDELERERIAMKGEIQEEPRHRSLNGSLFKVERAINELEDLVREMAGEDREEVSEADIKTPGTPPFDVVYGGAPRRLDEMAERIKLACERLRNMVF